MKLGTIKQELAACRKAWKGKPIGTPAWCCHYDVEIEPIWEPAENRIQFIMKYKPEAWLPLLLREFRPAEVPQDDLWDAYRDAWATYSTAEVVYNKMLAADGCNTKRAAYKKAWTARHKAWISYNKAWTAYVKKHSIELSRLHREQVPDTTWNGEMIAILREAKNDA